MDWVIISLIILLLITVFINKKEGFSNSIVRYCVVIPLYPPHYKYVKHIIENLEGIDIYFVFTTHAEFKQFTYPSKNNIILEDHITKEQIDTLTKKRSLPSFKKLFAMKLLYNQYDYILCIDAETKILKRPNIKRIYDSKAVIGGLTNNPVTQEIIKGTIDIFNDKNDKILENSKFYTWWSTMPIYDCKNIIDFMEKIGFNDINAFINKTNYYFFENLAYNYYCIVFQNFKKVVVPNINHSLEGQHSSIIEKYMKYNLGWISLNTYLQNQSFYDKQDNIYMVYHLDRV